MSINPPSDIVLDVARAADPARFSQAAARLGQAAPVDGSEFTDVMASIPPPAAEAAPATLALRTPALPKAIPPAAARAFQSFEAMTLATMIESAMPDSDAVFGSGEAGSVWKSLFAEQIAGEMAKSGGIGIAAQLAATGALTAYLNAAIEMPASAKSGDGGIDSAPAAPPIDLDGSR